MDTNVPAEPVEEDVKLFDVERFKNAPLVCNTPFSIGWRMSMGFTAEKTFYKTNEFKGYSSDWIHDEGVLRLESYLHGSNQFTMTTCFNYDSFQSINVDVQNVNDSSSDYYEILLTFVANYTPIFWSKRPDKQDKNRKYVCGRFYHEQYRSAVENFWNDLISASAFQIFYKVQVSFYFFR
uniref:Uncharacterized protein n=1 Tax=Panagrolaimus superbus TaxID=310955 RepID=A0A914YM94_9BILA